MRETCPLVTAPPSPQARASVVIPARDEADAIERVLAAVAAQRNRDGTLLDPISYETILVANNCRDGTATIARRWAARTGARAVHVVEIDFPEAAAHVGSARRAGMDEACRRLLTVGQPRGIIATTDADTLVEPTWLAATIHEVAAGAEAVGGRIVVAEAERRALPPPVRSRFLRHVGYGTLANEVTARIDPCSGNPWPCHEQFSGASIAVTARAYRAVGGLPILPSGEDAALAGALRRADIEIRHSLAVRVQTSGRLAGRAPSGLAALLAGWSSLTLDGPYQLVPSAATVVIRAVCRRLLRDLWRRARTRGDACVSDVFVGKLSDIADVPAGWLPRALISHGRFGALWREVEERAAWQRAPELVDVRVAIADLRAWLEPYRHQAAPAEVSAVHGAQLLPARTATARGKDLSLPPSSQPGVHGPARASRPPALAPLEEVQPVGSRAASLSPPPQVA